MWKPNVVVAAILYGLLVMIGAYDVWAATIKGSTWTVSYVVRGWGAAYPILPLIAGIVLGHLFWSPTPADMVVIPQVKAMLWLPVAAACWACWAAWLALS